MSNLMMRMFNRQASDPRNKPDQILEALKLRQGQVLADLGAGGGYFSLRFAEAVGREGRVYVVDTNQGSLRFIENSAKEKGLGNVQTVLATKEGLIFHGGSLDLVFARNVYHHLANRVEYFRRLRGALKREGRIAIIEYRRGKPLTFHGIFGHYVPQETIIKELGEAGYRVKQEISFLPEQSFTIFSP